MADNKKSDSSQAPSPASPALSEFVDDWDSLPLDPDSDDWDDIPPPKTDYAPNPESTSPPIPAAPIPPAADPPSFPDLPPGAVPPPDSGQIASLLGGEDEFNVDDFGDQLLDVDITLDEPESPADESDPPAGPGPVAADLISPDEDSTEIPVDDLNFDDLMAAAQETQNESTDGTQFQISGTEAPADQDYSEPGVETGPLLSSSDLASNDFPEPWADSDAAPDSDFDALNAHLGGPSLEGVGESNNGLDSASLLDKIEAELEDLPTKKVELDIEGIFLEDHDPPIAEAEPPEPEPQLEEEPSPPEAPPPAPEEAPAPKKIPKIKLLMLLVPALLLVCGLAYGVYKLFFSSSSGPEGPAPLVIDPTVPPRDPQPGSLDLGAFYVNFPGDRGETIMEMTVVLHYKDLPDRAAIEARLPMVRDIIYLVTQGQGSQVISNGEAQRLLRQAAAAQANAALGGDHIDYVQISQIRILQ